MFWRFCGERFGLDLDRNGATTLKLDPVWHKPIPDMGGPVPEMEIEQIEEIFGRPMQLRLRGGTPDLIIQAVTEFALVGAGVRIGAMSHQPRCMVTTLPDQPASIEVTATFAPEVFTAVIAAIHTFAASPLPRFFAGSISGNMIAGAEPVRCSDAEMESFLRGERPMMLAEPPSLAFGFGSAMPEPPAFGQVLKELKDQF